MRHWLWRAMGVLSLGGGFNGLVYAFTAALNGGPSTMWIALGTWTVFFGAGVWSGVRLLEGSPGAERLNLLYWWLQVPVAISPPFSFSFYCGAQAAVSAGLSWDQSGTDNFGFSGNALVGSGLNLSFMQPDAPWEFGVNLLALLVVVWGGRLLRRGDGASRPDIW